MNSIKVITERYLEQLRKRKPGMLLDEKYIYGDDADEDDIVENPPKLVNLDLHKMDFSGLTLSGIDFSNSNLSDCKFNDATVEECIFDGANLENVVFDNTVISENRFIGTNMKNCDFSLIEQLWKNKFGGANLYGTKFDGINIGKNWFNFANLEKASFKNCVLNISDFYGFKYNNMRESDFTNAKMYGVNIIGCDCSNSKFIEANLDNVTIQETNFVRSDMRHMCIVNTNIDECMFSYTNMAGSVFKKSTFTSIPLANYLVSTIMRDTTWCDCVIKKAYFDNTTLDNSSFKNCKLECITFKECNMHGMSIDAESTIDRVRTYNTDISKSEIHATGDLSCETW